MQLNSDWMADHGGPSSTTPFHVPRASVQHNFVDPRIVRRFKAVLFKTPGKAPMAIIIDKVPKWPLFDLASAGEDVAEFVEGLSETGKVDVYMPDTRQWFAIRLDTPQTVSKDCTLFLRRRYGDWDDVELEDYIKRYLPAPQQHIRYNLKDERRSVRDANKTPRKRPHLSIPPPSPFLSRSPSPSPSPMRRTIALPSVDSSDGDVIRNLKRRFEELGTNEPEPPQPTEEDDPVRRVRARPMLSINTNVDGFPPTPVLTPALTSAASSAPSSVPVTPVSASLELPAVTANSSKGFAGMYVVDVVAGFNHIDALASRGMGIAARFEAAFPGRRYIQVTYNENRRKWEKGRADLRQAALDAGRTPAGLWQEYTRKYSIACKQ
uniref:Uncharacterized protein n=1 Tax=Mycena chlorophos TaxID=658473 RepID=A0ABQ0L4R3_MYCCL|nr:predicted protein [Mycena chlorophos]